MSFTKPGLSYFFFQVSSLLLVFFTGLSFFWFFFPSFRFCQRRRFFLPCPEFVLQTTKKKEELKLIILIEFSNVLKTESIIERKKLLVHNSIIESIVETRLNR